MLLPSGDHTGKAASEPNVSRARAAKNVQQPDACGTLAKLGDCRSRRVGRKHDGNVRARLPHAGDSLALPVEPFQLEVLLLAPAPVNQRAGG